MLFDDGREILLGAPDRLDFDWTTKQIYFFWDERRGLAGTVVGFRTGDVQRQVVPAVTIVRGNTASFNQRIALDIGRLTDRR